MNKQLLDGNYEHNVWLKLIDDFSLSSKKVEQLQAYARLLIEWNEKFNLTAIIDPIGIAEHHFYDSLALARYIDFMAVSCTADIGTGAGFPGLPLKILFPHLTVILIEVNAKKRAFLEHVIQELGLENIIIYPFDWRSFLRGTTYSIDYFFARASLQPEELVRVFRPSSPYQQSVLVYWASQQWVAGKHEALYKEKEERYRVGDVDRKYIFFRKQPNSLPSTGSGRTG